MNSKNVMLIMNPCSGRKKTRNGLVDLVRVFGNNGYFTTVYMTKGSGDATEFALKYASNYDLIVCRGGDGTFSEMLNGLMQLESRPPIGFIPSGTTNELASTLGIPTNIRIAAENIFGNDASSNDIGLFNNSRYFTYVASFGAFSECSYAASQKLKNRIGRFAYFVESAKEVKDIRPIALRVECDDFTEEGEYVIGSVSNSHSIGGIIKLDENTVDLKDGKFEVFLGKNPGSVSAWKDTLISIANRDFDERYLRIIKTSKVSFTPLENDEIPWSIDGEFGGNNKRVDISVVQNAYQIFRPKQ